MLARAQVGGVQLFCKWSFRWGNLRRRRKNLGPVCAAGENLWALFTHFARFCAVQRDAARQARVNPAPCVAAQTQTGLCTRHARHHCSAWPAGASASTRPLPAAAAPRGRSPRTLEATWRRPVGWGPRDRLVCLPRLAVDQDSSLVPQAHLDQLPLLGQGLASLIPTHPTAGWPAAARWESGCRHSPEIEVPSWPSPPPAARRPQGASRTHTLFICDAIPNGFEPGRSNAARRRLSRDRIAVATSGSKEFTSRS